MRRITSAEWLDDDRGTPEEIRASFDDLWRINRVLGGVTGSMRLLNRFFSRTRARRASVLDVGAGDARLPERLKDGLKRRGIQTEFFAMDRRLSHLDGGHAAAGLHVSVADVFALPFAERSFDVVMCNLFLHHFSGAEARRLLVCLAAVARQAVLINDLERHLLPYLFIRVAIPFARSRITRNDGPASVRQAYTRDELAALAESAGFRNFEVVRMPAYRLGLAIWK